MTTQFTPSALGEITSEKPCFIVDPKNDVELTISRVDNDDAGYQIKLDAPYLYDSDHATSKGYAKIRPANYKTSKQDTTSEGSTLTAARAPGTAWPKSETDHTLKANNKFFRYLLPEMKKPLTIIITTMAARGYTFSLDHAKFYDHNVVDLASTSDTSNKHRVSMIWTSHPTASSMDVEMKKLDAEMDAFFD